LISTSNPLLFDTIGTSQVTFGAVAAHRYLLLVSPSTELADALKGLLQQVGVSEPLHLVSTDTAAVVKLNDPDHEPPVAVFVDAAGVVGSSRLIGWIVSSPTTHLIPVFAIARSRESSDEIERYKPTATISQPLDLAAITACIQQCPLLRPPTSGPNPPSPPRGPANPILLFC
jgi:hypothetical protein